MARSIEKSIKDYEKLVTETMTKYEMDRMNNKYTYTKKNIDSQGYSGIIITNSFIATKILYNHEMKLIVKREIFIGEVKEILEMVEELHG